jgi:hypothetical protein
MTLSVMELWVNMLVMIKSGFTNDATKGAVSSDLQLDIFTNIPVEPVAINHVSPLSNLLMGGSVNHHRPAVPFRESQKEQLQR